MPGLWSLDDPYLYRVVTIVRSGNETIDSAQPPVWRKKFSL